MSYNCLLSNGYFFNTYYNTNLSQDFLFKFKSTLVIKRVEEITIAIGIDYNNILLFNFFFFGIDNQIRVNDFKQNNK